MRALRTKGERPLPISLRVMGLLLGLGARFGESNRKRSGRSASAAASPSMRNAAARERRRGGQQAREHAEQVLRRCASITSVRGRVVGDEAEACAAAREAEAHGLRARCRREARSDARAWAPGPRRPGARAAASRARSGRPRIGRAQPVEAPARELEQHRPGGLAARREPVDPRGGGRRQLAPGVTTPNASSAARRSASTLVDTPASRRFRSLKRCGPSISSRRISRLQRLPSTSAARASGQNWA